MIRYPFTSAGARSALRALGRTANEVAANLLALGFRGARADCDDCPLAHYLTAVFPQAHTVRVGGDEVHLYVGSGATAVDVIVAHTRGTKAFLARYDNVLVSDYPELERAGLIEEGSHA